MVTNYSGPGISAPLGIAAGPDGAMWFTGGDQFGGLIGRITTAGKVTSYSAGLGGISGTNGIAPGPGAGGNIVHR